MGLIDRFNFIRGGKVIQRSILYSSDPNDLPIPLDPKLSSPINDVEPGPPAIFLPSAHLVPTIDLLRLIRLPLPFLSYPDPQNEPFSFSSNQHGCSGPAAE